MVRFQKSQSQVCSSYTVYRNIHFFNYLFKTVEGISFFYWFRENIPYFWTKLWDTFNPMIIHSLYKCYTEVMGCRKSYFCLSKYSYLKWGILYNLPHFHYKYLNIPMLNRNNQHFHHKMVFCDYNRGHPSWTLFIVVSLCWYCNYGITTLTDRIH